MDVRGARIGRSPSSHVWNGLKRGSVLTYTKITCLIGIVTYFWIVDFPENAHQSFFFLNEAEVEIAVRRIQEDRGDVKPAPFSAREVFRHFLDPKIYGFAASFFLLVYQSCYRTDSPCSRHVDRTWSLPLFRISCP